MNTHFRAEHMGSLLRPPELLAARAALAAGKITIEDLRAQEDQAILAAIEKQRSIGLDIFSDGEMRRGSWLTDMADAGDGFVSEARKSSWTGKAPAVVRKAARLRRPAQDFAKFAS
jgi:5-methyltetrahydropteroyltriglutamate--homocysteine methyltransferase